MSAKLFVGGLSWQTDDSMLLDAFQQYGTVVEARVVADPDTGRSRGFGFVTFADQESAEKARQAMNGQDLDGRQIRVDVAVSRGAEGPGGPRRRPPEREPRGGGHAAPTGAKLFVGGLSWDTDDESLHQAFSEFGEVVEARVVTDRSTGRSRGFGFVTYTSAESATRARAEMNGRPLDGRAIRVDDASNRASDGPRGGGGGGGGGGRRGGGREGGREGGGGREPEAHVAAGAKLFVGGLSWHTEDDGLLRAFERFGDVVEARVIKDRITGKSRGYGFVSYTDPGNATKARDSMNGQVLDGRTIRVNDATGPRPGASRGGGGGGGGGRRYEEQPEPAAEPEEFGAPDYAGEGEEGGAGEAM